MQEIEEREARAGPEADRDRLLSIAARLADVEAALNRLTDAVGATAEERRAVLATAVVLNRIKERIVQSNEETARTIDERLSRAMAGPGADRQAEEKIPQAEVNDLLKKTDAAVTALINVIREYGDFSRHADNTRQTLDYTLRKMLAVRGLVAEETSKFDRASETLRKNLRKARRISESGVEVVPGLLETVIRIFAPARPAPVPGQPPGAGQPLQNGAMSIEAMDDHFRNALANAATVVEGQARSLAGPVNTTIAALNGIARRAATIADHIEASDAWYRRTESVAEEFRRVRNELERIHVAAGWAARLRGIALVVVCLLALPAGAMSGAYVQEKWHLVFAESDKTFKDAIWKRHGQLFKECMQRAIDSRADVNCPLTIKH